MLNALYKRNCQVQIHGPMSTAGLDKLDEATYESLLAVLERHEQSLDLKEFGEVWKSGRHQKRNHVHRRKEDTSVRCATVRARA